MKACNSCSRRLYKASGLLRCIERRNVSACSAYVGAFKDLHVSLPWGSEYSDSLSRERGTKQMKIKEKIKNG